MKTFLLLIATILAGLASSLHAAHWPDRSTLPIPLSPFESESTIVVDFNYAGGGAGKGASISLSVNDETVAQGEMEATVGGCFGIGEDSGQPVTHEYHAPFTFTGEIEKVVEEIK